MPKIFHGPYKNSPVSPPPYLMYGPLPLFRPDSEPCVCVCVSSIFFSRYKITHIITYIRSLKVDF